MTFTTPTDAATAAAFIRELHSAGLLYHPEDDAADCLAHHNLPADTLATIQRNMDATFALLDDPCEVALDLAMAA